MTRPERHKNRADRNQLGFSAAPSLRHSNSNSSSRLEVYPSPKVCSVGQTLYENLSCDNLGFWVLSVPWRTPTLIAVVSTACIARYACKYALPPLTTCTAYLHMMCCILTQCVTFIHNLSCTARPCYTVSSIINAQISLVPRLPISFLLALPVIKRRLPLNLCIHSLFHHYQSTYINTGNI